MKTRNKPENPNDHKKATPSTRGKEKSDKHFTSYDTSKKESESPQEVRENAESPALHEKSKKEKGQRTSSE